MLCQWTIRRIGPERWSIATPITLWQRSNQSWQSGKPLAAGQPAKRYILCGNYLHYHTSCANLSNQMDRPITDLTGRKFGKWVVLPRNDVEPNDRHSNWLVQCECGRLRVVASQDLLTGRSSSCGCASSRKSGHDGKTSTRSDNGKTSALSDNGKTSVRASVALRMQLQRVMDGLRPEGTGPNSERPRDSDLFNEDTQSDRRMIV